MVKKCHAHNAAADYDNPCLATHDKLHILAMPFAKLVKKRPHPGNAFANVIFIVMRETEAKVIVELSFG